MDDSLKLPQTSGILIGGINSKKKPPRLKSADRTISVAIENYLPQKPSSLSSSSLLIDNNPIIIDEPAAIITTTKTSNHHLLRRQQSSILQLPPTVITQSSSSQSLSTANKHLLSEQYNPNDRDNKIFYLDEMGCPHLRKSSFRRSDTLDVQNPSGYLLRKTHSFHHTNDDAIDDYIATNNDYRDHLLVSRSTTNNSNSNNSINTAKLRQNFLLSQQMNQTFDEQSPQTRRNCRMHRSFVEHHSNDNNNLRLGGSSNASNLNKKDAIKCRSFNDEIYIDPTHLLQQAQSKIKFNSANVSIENDLYRSHNLSMDNSNNDLYMDYQIKQHGVQPMVGVTGTASSSSINKKYLLNRGNTMENFMIDPKTQFKRSQRNTNSFYMNHSNNQSDDLQHILNKSQSPTTASSSRLFDTAQNIRRLHSASLKFRNNKENLMIQAKKSKSFITDIGYPANSFDSTNTTTLTSSMQSFGGGVGGVVSGASSSNRRDSNTLFPSDDGFHNIKKSPIRRMDHNHHHKLSYDLDDLDHIERSPIIQSPLIDHHNDYNHMVRNFRHQSLKLQQHHQRKNSIGTLGTAAGALNTNLRRKSTKKKKSSLTLSQSNSSNLSNSNTNDITDPDIDNNSNSNSLKLNKKILDSDKTLTDTDNNNDNNNDNKRKRKKIVCIIMTVFLSLVFASVFVVVITLTHSGVAQVHNHTRKYYTFSRDSPIHYNGII